MHTDIQTSQKEAYTSSIPNTPIRFLLYVTKPHKWWAFFAFSTVFVAQVLGTSIPYIFKSIIDTAYTASEGVKNSADVWFWAIAYLCALGLMFVGWRFAGFIGMQWATRSNATAYKTLFEYLSQHSYTYFSNRFAGSLSSKVSHASEGTQSLIEAFVWNYFSTAVALVLTTLYLLSANVWAAFFFIMLLFLLIPLNVYLAKYRRPHVVQFSEQATRARGYAVDTITNIVAVRQFSRRADEQQRFTREIDQMRFLNLRQWRISEWGLAINNVFIVAFEAVVILVSVQAWISDAISVGELVMIITLMLNVQGSLIFIGNSMNGFIRRYGEIEEGLTDILTEHEILDKKDAHELRVTNGEIVWKNVTFEYEKNAVFTDFNLAIRSGERIGLVGPSGAGKTTFVSLLLRQHELKDGTIIIDGEDIAGVTQDSLRENIAVVPQEPMLFHRTIKENIAYGKPGATDEEIIDVARKAQAHGFISDLSDGYDTLVGERGVKLSGGQKQRIAIARAMLKNAPILVLDEATSALDSESEVAIQKALQTLMEGKTVIAIAHRLSTLREMDRIVVLETGKIVEDGKHATLIKGKGTYSRLWEHQAGGFLQEGDLTDIVPA